MSNMVLMEDMRVVHAIGFEMLCAFDKMCRDAGLSYSLAGGTLLGAIRHKGFIPWDDDIDVFLLRPDYEKFIEIYNNKPLENPNYRLVHTFNGAPGITFARILDERTKVVCDKSTTMNNLWIDIFPLDAVPTEEGERIALKRKLRKLRRRRLFFNAPPFTGRTRFRAIIKTPIAAAARKMGMQEIYNKKIIAESQSVPYDTTIEVGELVAQGKVKGTTNKETFRDSVLVEFEGREFMAMPDYDHYLQGQYGDYMQLPPIEQQKAHSVKVYVDVDAYDEETRKKFNPVQ